MKVKDLIEILNRYNLEDKVIVRLELLDEGEVHDFPINEIYGLGKAVVLEIMERDKEVR